MNKPFSISSLVCMAVFAFAGICCSAQPPANIKPPAPPKPTIVSFEEQLEVFKKLGFEIKPDLEAEVKKEWKADKDIEKRPFMLLYMNLGGTIEREPFTPLTDRCWEFDTEAIEDHGAYVEILKNAERNTRGEIKFENKKDYVDVEEGIAWISFEVRGEKYKWDLEVNDDWADPSFFTKLAGLEKKIKTKGRFTYFDTGGQSFVLGYETPESLEEIKKATGLNIVWLD